MKRVLTLTGAILGTCFGALCTIFYLISMINVLQASSVVGGGVVILSIFEFLLMSVTLALNASSISTWNKDEQVFKKKFGLLITSVIFDFITVIWLIVAAALAPTILNVILCVIAGLGLIATGVLLIIDLVNESKRINNANVVQENTTVNNASVNTPTMHKTAINTTTVSKQPVKTATSDIEALESKLEKLAVMRAKGMITEEEYLELKKAYIQKQTKL